MFSKRFVPLTALLALAAVFTLRSRADEALSDKRRDEIKHSVQDLVNELDRLQDDVVVELEGKEKRKLYQRIDRISSNLDSLYGKLGSQLTREMLYKQFDPIDKDVHQLLKIGESSAYRTLRQSTRRAYFADLDLHYLITLEDASPERRLETSRRQARAFTDTTEKIKKSAVLAFVDGAPIYFSNLAKSAAELEKRLRSTDDPTAAKKQFRDMNRHWVQVVDVIKTLPPRRNTYLLRSAVRMDRLHKRLFEMLMIEGKRTVLTIQI